MEYWNGQEWQEMVMRTVKRNWKERLFTLPWHPWVATKKVYPEDWEKIKIDGTYAYWARYRLSDGE